VGVVEGEHVTPALFLVFGAVLVVSALMVILSRNPVTSALFLVLAFCSLAGVYLLLHAEFLALVQIIVYAGAIMVLFLFVIMYLNLKQDVETGIQIALRRGFGWLLVAIVGAFAWALFQRNWAPGPSLAVPVVQGNSEAIGRELYSRYLFPFEITSIILLAAMIGVIVIGKGRRGGPIE
jgi:NADH-quinone oxidoreductase subunit J